jgi:hypothetical protein
MALTNDEDAELRRLGLFEKHGLLHGDMERNYEHLRQRDRRTAVREQAGADFWPEWDLLN